MKITNVQVYGEDGVFRSGEVTFHDGVIGQTCSEDCTVIDGKGGYLIPGLIDVHFHGCVGHDLCDANPEGLAKIAAYEASNGITSICPASMTIEVEQLHKVMETVRDYDVNTPGACLVGINLEGPFISPQKKGAQPEEYIQVCNLPLYRALQEGSGNKIKLVDIAPETAGAMEFIEAVKDEVRISIAHTMADYDTATRAFVKGASHVTHLYNAMPPFAHRDPGVIGAAFDWANNHVELICDGIHIHPSVVRATFQLFGRDRVVLISDSMNATGLSNGTYSLGGQEVIMKDGVCRIANGSLAGSATHLMDCLRRAVKMMGIPLQDAVWAATHNPAQVLGIYNDRGSISEGKRADLVLLDADLNIQTVFIAGKEYTGD